MKNITGKVGFLDVYNTDAMANGYHICGVMWKTEKYMIIENEETFDEASKDGFVPIASFRTLAEFNKAIFRNKYEV